MKAIRRGVHVSLARRVVADSHAFRMWEEHRMLESLLSPGTQPETLRFVEQMKQLRQLEQLKQDRRGRADTAGAAAAAAAADYGEPLAADAKIQQLVTEPSLSAKDIDTWLKINVLASESPPNARAQLEAAVLRMIKYSSANSLRAIMLYLAQYWQAGLYGEKPYVASARKQALAVLSRALEVHRPTHYVQSQRKVVPQVGLPDMQKFERFAAALFEYMELPRVRGQDLDPVDDMLFRLAAKCGSVEQAQALLVQILRSKRQPSRQATDEFVGCLSRHLDMQRDVYEGSPAQFNELVKKDLVVLRALMVNREVTPAKIRFLLLWVSTPDEFYSAATLADHSRYSREIYSDCQLELLRTLCGLYSLNSSDAEKLEMMAQCFGLLKRIQKYTPLQPETLSSFMITAARFGNASGVIRALEIYDSMANSPLPEATVGQLLDIFPLSNFPSCSATASEVLVHKLRQYVTPSMLGRYVSALRRGNDAATLEKEWGQLPSTAADDELYAVFIASFSSVGRPDLANTVLQHALSTPARVSIVSHVLQHDLLPEPEVYRAVARSASDGSWSDHDIEVVLGHNQEAKAAVLHGDENEINAMWPLSRV